MKDMCLRDKTIYNDNGSFLGAYQVQLNIMLTNFCVKFLLLYIAYKSNKWLISIGLDDFFWNNCEGEGIFCYISSYYLVFLQFISI